MNLGVDAIFRDFCFDLCLHRPTTNHHKLNVRNIFDGLKQNQRVFLLLKATNKANAARLLFDSRIRLKSFGINPVGIGEHFAAADAVASMEVVNFGLARDANSMCSMESE